MVGLSKLISHFRFVFSRRLNKRTKWKKEKVRCQLGKTKATRKLSKLTVQYNYLWFPTDDFKRKMTKLTDQRQFIYNYLWFHPKINIKNYKGKQKLCNWHLLNIIMVEYYDRKADFLSLINVGWLNNQILNPEFSWLVQRLFWQNINKKTIIRPIRKD